MRLKTIKQISLAVLFSAISFTLAAHNKVVVIPLLETIPPRVYAPMKTDNAPREDYFIHSQTLRDLVTGLEWQRNGDGLEYSWTEARDYCGDLTLNQLYDWRLPTIRELIGIADYSRISPALSVQAFPNNNLYYWSSSYNNFEYNSFNLPERIRVLRTALGTTELRAEEDLSYVRCVRGGYSNGSTYIDNGDGTVLDLSFGLMWEQATFQESNTFSNLADATNYCQQLDLAGFENWRMPTVKEMISLLETRTSVPSQMNAVFNYSSGFTRYFWTGTNASFSTPPDNIVVRLGSNSTSARPTVGFAPQDSSIEGGTEGGVKCVRKVN